MNHVDRVEQDLESVGELESDVFRTVNADGSALLTNASQATCRVNLFGLTLMAS